MAFKLASNLNRIPGTFSLLAVCRTGIMSPGIFVAGIWSSGILSPVNLSIYPQPLVLGTRYPEPCPQKASFNYILRINGSAVSGPPVSFIQK